MATLDEMATAALGREGLRLRALVQDFLRENKDLNLVPAPASDRHEIRATAAALLELFAGRRNQPAPAWTSEIGALPEPFYLVASADLMPRLRRMCESDAPEPLRKRKLYAPPNFLTFV